MGALTKIRLETAIDAAAATVFAMAAAYASFALLPSWAGAVAAAAFAGSLLALRSLPADRPRFALAAFEPLPMPCVAELVLTEADRAGPAEHRELVLDDVLGAPAADARVVRLFDPAAMPTPGELHGRIERHLGSSAAAPADASHELFQALADLRRSLR